MSVARMRANTGAVWFGSASSTVRFVFVPAPRRAAHAEDWRSARRPGAALGLFGRVDSMEWPECAILEEAR